MKTWKTPPVIKVYEALGAIADGRVEMVGENAVKVYSSDGSKYYDVSYDPETRAIMANDNGSYWVGYLGYPSIAFLMMRDILPFDERSAELLQGIEWKKRNVANKNDFEKTMKEILDEMTEEDRNHLKAFADEVLRRIESKPFGKFGKRQKPPKG